jgi:hypothetical protein
MKTSTLIAGALKITFIATFCTCAEAQADTFTVPLNFSSQSGDGGQYLSADYDFQTQFSEIDSATLHFTMPGGYLGIAVAAGYSSVFSQLWMVVHPSDTVPTFGYILGGAPTPLIGTNAFEVPINSPQQFGFYPPVVFTDPPVNLWPDFLFSGTGNLAITDFVTTSSGFQGTPLPDEVPPPTSTQTWQLPGEVTDASLTIVGTAVPEPPTAILLALYCAGIGLLGRKSFMHYFVPIAFPNSESFSWAPSGGL